MFILRRDNKFPSKSRSIKSSQSGIINKTGYLFYVVFPNGIIFLGKQTYIIISHQEAKKILSQPSISRKFENLMMLGFYGGRGGRLFQKSFVHMSLLTDLEALKIPKELLSRRWVIFRGGPRPSCSYFRSSLLRQAQEPRRSCGKAVIHN